MFFPGLTNLPSFNFKKSVLFIWNKQYLWNIVQIRKKYILPSTKLRKWKPWCKLTKVHVTWDLQKNTNFYQFFQPIYMRLIPIILARGRIPKHVTRQLLQRQFSPPPQKNLPRTVFSFRQSHLDKSYPRQFLQGNLSTWQLPLTQLPSRFWISLVEVVGGNCWWDCPW